MAEESAASYMMGDMSFLLMQWPRAKDPEGLEVRLTAGNMGQQLLWSEEFQCHYWTQDMYGRQSTYLDGVHGFVATVFVLIKGRHLLAPQEWQAWERCIEQTMARIASEKGGLANWRAQLITAAGEKPRLLMLFAMHGIA